METVPGWEWIALAYVIGSIATVMLTYKSITIKAIENTIDKLCDDGFIRHRKKNNGEIELLKYDHTHE
jgi:hypothetical protein